MTGKIIREIVKQRVMSFWMFVVIIVITLKQLLTSPAHNLRDNGNPVCRFRVRQWESVSLTALP